MLDTSLPFIGFSSTEDLPNIAVDGAPNRSTVLSLTHWPGVPAPRGYAADLSAQMAFKYIEQPVSHAPAQAVTNNHFDQDGLVSVHALVAPAASLRHRDVLIDVAAAGDFATYRDRTAARASMTIWAYAAPDRSPIAHELSQVRGDDFHQLLYERLLPLLIPMVTDPERFKPVWAEEDARLSASERAVEDRLVTIEEQPEDDLAIIRLPTDLPASPGHRFGTGARVLPEVHPMAIHNASSCFRQLFVRGARYSYVDRYESWVQYQSRRPRPRVDLRPLAAALTALEPGSTVWRADPPSALAPELTHDRPTALTEATVRAHLVEHLRSAPAGWDPYRLAQID